MNKHERERLAHQILRDIGEINAYDGENKTLAALWAAGYLAGYIADMAAEDPFVYKKLRRQMETQSKPGRGLK